MDAARIPILCFADLYKSFSKWWVHWCRAEVLLWVSLRRDPWFRASALWGIMDAQHVLTVLYRQSGILKIVSWKTLKLLICDPVWLLGFELGIDILQACKCRHTYIWRMHCKHVDLLYTYINMFFCVSGSASNLSTQGSNRVHSSVWCGIIQVAFINSTVETFNFELRMYFTVQLNCCIWTEVTKGMRNCNSNLKVRKQIKEFE